jgi:hypothetical protein
VAQKRQVLAVVHPSAFAYGPCSGVERLGSGRRGPQVCLFASTMWGAAFPLLALFLHLLSTAPSPAVAALGLVRRMLAAPAWLCARQPYIALFTFSVLSCLLYLASRQLCRWRRGRSSSEGQKRHKIGSSHHTVLRVTSFLFLSWLTLCLTAYTTACVRDFVFGQSVQSLLSHHSLLSLKLRVRLLHESDQLGAGSASSRCVKAHVSQVSFPPDWVSGGAHSVKTTFCEKSSTFSLHTSHAFSPALHYVGIPSFPSNAYPYWHHTHNNSLYIHLDPVAAALQLPDVVSVGMRRFSGLLPSLSALVYEVGRRAQEVHSVWTPPIAAAARWAWRASCGYASSLVTSYAKAAGELVRNPLLCSGTMYVCMPGEAAVLQHVLSDVSSVCVRVGG